MQFRNDKMCFQIISGFIPIGYNISFMATDNLTTPSFPITQAPFSSENCFELR